MALEHAERNLAVIRRLPAGTGQFIPSQQRPISDQSGRPENRTQS
jgi:hypothetical protein